MLFLRNEPNRVGDHCENVRGNVTVSLERRVVCGLPKQSRRLGNSSANNAATLVNSI